jgi:uncharacterized membrane protein YkoI
MTKRWLSMTGALLLIGFAGAQAQLATSETRIRVQKDAYLTSSGDVDFAPTLDADIAEARLTPEWYRPETTTCSGVDMNEVRTASIDADLYNPQTMITPEQAKITALCVVPGHIGSGEMEVTNGRTEYEIAVLPRGKMTYTKVIIDAQTGAVLSTKQFGGLRGLAGWVRENFERRQ